MRGDDKVIPTDGWQYSQFAYRHTMPRLRHLRDQLGRTAGGDPWSAMGRQVPVAATGAEGDSGSATA